MPGLRDIRGASLPQASFRSASGDQLPAGYVYYVDENGDYYVDENGDYYVVYAPSGNWWDTGVPADAYGGEFESALDASFLVIEGVWTEGGGSDQWESLQSDSNYLDNPVPANTIRASGATEISGVNAVSTITAGNHAGLDGGTGNDQVFMLWAGTTTDDYGFIMQHATDETFGIVSMERTESGGQFQISLTIGGVEGGSGFSTSYEIGSGEAIVCAACWVTQTTYKFWVNGEIVASGSHSRSFTLTEDTLNRTAVSDGAAIAAAGWGYSEPSDVPAMMRAVTKYWQDGTAYDPS